MSDLQAAKEIIRAAEVQLRQLIQKAFGEHRYKDMADVASMADGLRSLIDGNAAAKPHPSPVHPAVPTAPVAAPTATRQRRSVSKPTESDYPRFERDGNKLVKIGWSRKDKRAYEHRAPREVIFRVGHVLNEKVAPGNLFTMEKILPLRDVAGSEIPSYQVYLALAWFRATGAVDQKGKDGYTLVNGLLETTQLQGMWDSLPTHR